MFCAGGDVDFCTVCIAVTLWFSV